MVRLLEIFTVIFVLSSIGSGVCFFYKLLSIKRSVQEGSATLFPRVGIEIKEHNTLKSVDANLFSFSRSKKVFIGSPMKVSPEVQKAFIYGNRSQD